MTRAARACVIIKRTGRRRFSRWGLAALPGLLPTGASAHVKWFASYDIAAAPTPLRDVFSPDFGELALLSIALIWIVAMLETIGIGRAVLAGLDDLTSGLRARSDVFLRAALGAFFVALWMRGGVILTPELTTLDPRIEWLQAAIAIGLLWQTTLGFSGLGILLLFFLGIRDYGLFHMLDYPVFLGLAVYLMLSGWQPSGLIRPPIALLRWSAGITLMWASIEKWGYPGWTFPVLEQHSRISLGLDPGFFMTASGMVEFGCAFALIWTPLVRRLAAVALVSTFTSAIVEFGKIDAVGHLPIIAALLLFIAETPDQTANPLTRWRKPYLVPLAYTICLIGFIAAYYGLHGLLVRAVSI